MNQINHRHTRAFATQLLQSLKTRMNSVPNTGYTAFAKTLSLVYLNCSYERFICIPEDLKNHPYEMLEELVQKTHAFFECLLAISFIETDKRVADALGAKTDLLKKHKELWQVIWSKHSLDEFRDFVNIKRTRFEINDLADKFLGSTVVELGCGNAVNLVAALELGAKMAYGCDWGDECISHGKELVAEMGLSDRIHLKKADLLNSGYPNNMADFVISNGVFHHLREQDIPLALSECYRILKPGGYFWYYVDGNSLLGEIYDMSVNILADVKPEFMTDLFGLMNVGRDKMAHLVDGLNATYLHSTYAQVCEQLSNAGFVDFKRMAGGRAFDLDPTFSKDPYAVAKHGDGDIRI
ncbi:MAG: class I SAM-dependent methyltransferase [Candidatus Cloacimonetes bacterium]|nr:class I SAM-dependent methyltransferase [Candidatus Cloacimonadota bacterium]